MIHDLRWIKRKEITYGEGTGLGLARTIKVLQYNDGHTWFDVPTVKEE